jgi:hypothetical protein
LSSLLDSNKKTTAQKNKSGMTGLALIDGVSLAADWCVTAADLWRLCDKNEMVA